MAFQIFHNQGIPYLLAPNLVGHSKMLHAFTTRHGGVSQNAFSSLNLGLHVEDNYQDVIANRERIAALFGCKITDTVSVHQIHGTKVQKVDINHKGQGAYRFDDSIPQADAMVTDVPGVLLWCFFADCVPVLFYDHKRQVIAVAHAGWRGTHLRIPKKTVEIMVAEYGCEPENILAAIGPSVGSCCYEVDSDIDELFKQAAFTDVTVPYGDKHKLDLWKANLQSLQEAGIPNKNIEVAKLCTACLNELFFSYRAENGRTGRLAAAIMLKP